MKRRRLWLIAMTDAADATVARDRFSLNEAERQRELDRQAGMCWQRSEAETTMGPLTDREVERFRRVRRTCCGRRAS